MIYKPSVGRMWDPSILWHAGKYYMFAMHNPGEGDLNMWVATSEDGVHWSDLGPAIESAPWPVWKMFVFKVGDGFVLDHGSFSGKEGHGNDTLKFWKSRDLVSWEYLGADHDSTPDERWYDVRQRWDHMYVVPKDDGSGYWGWCVGTALPEIGYRACGLLESVDGERWTVLPPPVFEWGDMAQEDLEYGGCEKIGEKWYLLGGCYQGTMGSYGYAVMTLTADGPTGPFRPDREAFRLCGATGFDGTWGVQFLASFGRGDGELMITNYVDVGKGVWLTAMKKAVVDEAGHLRMGYWMGNEKAKGEAIAVEAAREMIAEQGSWGSWRDGRAVEMMDASFDLERGVIVEGKLRAERLGFPRPEYAGFVIEEEGGHTAILLEIGVPAVRRALIGKLRGEGEAMRLEAMDETGPGCATVTGVDDGREHSFRLWVRKGMLELYVDDLLMQTFFTGETTGRVGFLVQNCKAAFSDVKAWAMSF